MHQIVKGISMYVVEFDIMPQLPITGLTPGEKTYRRLLNRFNSFEIYHERTTYAKALTDAFVKGIISEPGTYGVHLVPGTLDYEIYKINE